MSEARTDTKQAWDEVGAGCTQLGGRLKRHFAQAREEDGVEAAEAVRKLLDAVGDAFEAVGKAARDPEVRAETRKVAGSLTEALGATFADVGDEVRRVFKGPRRDEPGAPPTPDGGSAGSWAPPSGATHATGAPPEDQLPD